MNQFRGPLRRVIGYCPNPDYPDIPELVREVYECGHMARPKTDVYGSYRAYRRRCSACAAGSPTHLNPVAIEVLRKS